MPERSIARKKMRSCDNCALTKKVCNHELPCSTCTTKQRPCTYQRITANAGNERQPRPPKDTSADNFDMLNDYTQDDPFASTSYTDSPWLNLECSPSFLGPEALQMFNDCALGEFNAISNIPSPSTPNVEQPPCEFLLNFTQATSLRSVFNYGRPRRPGHTLEAYGQLPQDPATLALQVVNNLHTRDEMNWELIPEHDLLNQDPLAPYWLPVTPCQSQETSGIDRVVEWLEDPLFAQTKCIWDDLRGYMSHFKGGSDNSGRATARCLEFFRPSHLRKFISLYWAEWYPHSPVVHRPTFDVLQAPTMLLAPMVLLGACMSPSEEDVSYAREWLDVVEAFVFSCPLFSGDGREDGKIAPNKVIQSALLVCLVQNWEGSSTVKRRIRQQRFVTLISAVREIGLSTAVHMQDEDTSSHSFDWLEFVQKEEMIRTFTYVFLLDTAFVIFNNAPPRMVLHEMVLDLTCPEPCFQAEDAAKCNSSWQTCFLNNELTSPRLLLAEAIEVLAAQKFDPEMSLYFSSMSTLNHFTIVAGIHIMIFQQATLPNCLPNSLQYIRRSLDRLEAAWNSRKAESSKDRMYADATWQEQGFIEYTHDFIRLAMAHFDRFQSISQPKVNVDKASRKNKRTPGALDDTSMSHVTDLLLSLVVLDD